MLLSLDIAQPDVAQPDVAYPDVAGPDVAKPDNAKPFCNVFYLGPPWFTLVYLVYSMSTLVNKCAFNVH